MTTAKMDFFDSDTAHVSFTSSENLLSFRFRTGMDSLTPLSGAVNVSRRAPMVVGTRFKINYIITVNDEFLPSDDHRVESLMNKYASSELWDRLHYKVELQYSAINTFEAHFTDCLLTESVLAKFDTNILDNDAVAQLHYITLHLNYYTLDTQLTAFTKEANYAHYTLLLCHWEHQMPLVFNIQARDKFQYNFKHAGSVSYSLTNSSKIMIKLLRMLDSDGGSVSEELRALSRDRGKRRRVLRESGVMYPIQFFHP